MLDQAGYSWLELHVPFDSVRDKWGAMKNFLGKKGYIEAKAGQTVTKKQKKKF